MKREQSSANKSKGLRKMKHIVSQGVGPVNILTGPITKHLQFLTSSTKYVTEMRSKMKVLECKSEDVKMHLEINKTNNKEIPTDVEGWMENVRNVKNEVQRISSTNFGCLYAYMRYQVGRNSFNKTTEIERLTNEEIGWSDANILPLQSVNRQTFMGALKFLQQDDNASRVIALCGMCGVGKTTMMEQLTKVAEDNNMFDRIVKVDIGQNPDMLSIQKDMADQYIGDHDLPESSNSVMADRLYKKFEEWSRAREKILVVLDDVWEKIELNDIGLKSPLPNGVTLLLTSRNSNVCTQIAANARTVLQEVRVDVLEEVEALYLFSQITRISEEDDYDKYLIGRDIVRKCGCLPLAIEVIASTLRSKEDHVWKDTLDNLKNNDLDYVIEGAIMKSYEHIKDDENKEIFLYCGLFPEDYDIKIEHLARVAWGLKLLANVVTLRETRNKINLCLHNLRNANLLIDSEQVGCVKMHTLMHAFVLRRVFKGDLEIVNHGNVSKSGSYEMGKEACKTISLSSNGVSEFPRDFKYPNLKLLQLMYGDLSLQFPKDFDENVENHQVITYYNMQYPRLPRSLQCSNNLTSLCLYKCILMFDCSVVVGDLVNLEVLSFAHCGICMLPSTIGNLRKLKLLDLTGCANLHIDDGVFKNLKKLEELYMTASNQERIRFTQANIEELKMLSGNLCVLEVEFVMETSQMKQIYSKELFKKLNKFKISIGCMLETEDKDETSSRNTLKVVMDSSSDLLDCKINKLFKKTDKLHLQVHDMIALRNIVSNPSYVEHSFQNLRDLEVSNCVNLKYLFPISVASGLKTLEYLTVRSCFVLEALVHDHNNGSEIRSGGEFKKLKSLRLKDLPNLVSPFLVDNVFELPELVELHVYGLPNFTSIYPDKNGISAVLNSQVRTAKLEKLKIGHMKKLEQIWDCSSEEEVDNNISMLREIEVEGCDSLVNLFQTNPMRLLNRLEKITVIKCGSIEVLFDIDLGRDFGENNQVCNSSLRSINVQYSEKLRMLWRIKSGENNSTLLLCRDFENLERIKIDNCKRFRSLFTPSNIEFVLRALMDIRICGCREISLTNEEKIEFWSRKERDDNNVYTVAFPFNLMHTFHSLQTLYIGDLNDVEVVFELDSCTTKNHQPILPNLQYLRLHDLKSMSHVWEWRNDWNKFLILRERSSFHNLTAINMMECNNIRYLFSPLMAKLLFNLKRIEIIWCDAMEEVVSNKYDDEEMNSSTYPQTNTYLFPRLHLLKFEWLKNLKRIGGKKDTTSVLHDQFKLPEIGHVIPWSLCQYSREMYINGCHGLSSVIPYYATPHMQKLQVLQVYSCESLREVFEAQANVDDHNENQGGSSSTDTTTTKKAIPRLENIIVPQFSNLKKLAITHCDLLQHVFTFSTLESLEKLEELMIKECGGMNVIVKQDEENGTTTPKVVVFPRLKTLKLLRLQYLKGFFLGSNDFEWPLLEKVIIMECPRIVSFTGGHSTTPKLEYIQTSLGKYSLDLNFCGTRDFNEIHSEGTSSEPLRWSFRDLIEIDMNDDWEVKDIISSDKLLKLQKLERIRAYNCCCINEVFEVAGVVKHITTSDGFDKSHSVVEIANLKQVELYSLASLKYIWESNHQQKTILLCFPNLTTLSIDKCNSLKHVFTSSMVDSLVQLQHVHITHCKNMEVIVKEELRVLEYDAKVKVKEIVLPYLKSLKLEKLKSIKGFCLGDDDFYWPSLHTLKINECPEIMVFTKGYVATPTLDIIDTSFGRCYLEGDINSFLKTKQHEGFQF